MLIAAPTMNKMLATNTNCWVHFCKLSFWKLSFDLLILVSQCRLLSFESSKVFVSASFLIPGRRKYLILKSFLCLSLHLYMTQEVTILQTQFKTPVVSFWLSYAVWWMFTNTLIYKFQPTNMADNKNDVIFFLGAGTLYRYTQISFRNSFITALYATLLVFLWFVLVRTCQY